MDHQIIRAKLAEMARQIEALHDNVERIAYQFKMGVPDMKLGGQCALLKVQASKTFEFCAREASQIFGGSSIVREGKVTSLFDFDLVCFWLAIVCAHH